MYQSYAGFQPSTPFDQRIISPWSKIFFFKLTVSFKEPLGVSTHYQKTNFKLFQTVCRRQFQIWHCGKRRNCSLRTISPFPTVFFEGFSQWGQKVLLCGNGLSHIQWQAVVWHLDLLLYQTTRFYLAANRKHLQKANRIWLICQKLPLDIEQKTLCKQKKALVTSSILALFLP